MVDMGKRGLTTGHPAKDSFDLALALREAGHTAEARAVAEEAGAALIRTLKGAKPGPLELAALGSLEVAAGHADSAAHYLARAEAAPKPDANSLMGIAELQALLGRKQDALASLRKALAAGYSEFLFPVIIPGFQLIRNDPEFKALFSRTR
jgi:tetratricopeptide (TPR) repeat protein